MTISERAVAMNEPSPLQVASLVTYEVAADGTSVKLNLLDGDGKPASLIVPFAVVQALARNMPSIALHALRQAAGNDSLRLVHEVSDWKIERGADPDYAILSFATPDLFEVSFAVRDDALAQMAELLSDYHIEAFPEGLHLQ